MRKRYRSTQAVDGISLTVARGETVGILGANGAGKTTLVEMVAGLRTPDTGSVQVLGLHPTRDRARLRQVLGVQLQNAYLHHALTARELVELYRSFYPDPRGTDETLALVELGGQLEGAGRGVGAGLLGVAGAGDDGGDAVLGGRPRERHLRRRRLRDEEPGIIKVDVEGFAGQVADRVG